MNKKLTIGIDINEVLRANWLQFDKIFANEFGEEGIPDEPYCYDFFKHYPWKDTKEVENILKEPDEIPDDFNVIDYQTDEHGVAKVDALLFDKKNVHLTAKEVYNRFMFQDYTFELFSKAPQLYRGLDLHLQQFYKKYKDTVDFILVSKENWFSRPYTLMFLSVMQSRFNNIRFVDETSELWNDVDLLITTDPEILNGDIPKGKAVIKVKRPYNVECVDFIGGLEILQVADLLESEDFQKMINYEEPKIKENE